MSKAFAPSSYEYEIEVPSKLCADLRKEVERIPAEMHLSVIYLERRYRCILRAIMRARFDIEVMEAAQVIRLQHPDAQIACSVRTITQLPESQLADSAVA